MTDRRRVALVTGDVPEYRLAPFRALAERVDLEVLAFGAVAAGADFAVLRVSQTEAVRRVGDYRAVVCGLGGRVALPGAYAGARRARIPFVLWTSIWEHPRTVAHALSWLAVRHLYRASDAVVTYGPHVSRHVQHVRSRGAVFEAPQAVDPEVFGRAVGDDEIAAARDRAGAGPDQALVLFVGRLVREKGIDVLREAWPRAALGDEAVLACAGEGPLTAPGTRLGRIDWANLPALYAAADALVLPSIRTRTFTEPWGLVTNEAMHQATPAIVSDAVGAAAGGLVRDGRNGFVVRAEDADALAARIQLVIRNSELRRVLSAAAREDVAAYTPHAWATGVISGLEAALGVRLLR